MKSNRSNKRVAIIGAGAVGGYYGARLAENGADVTFLLRSDYDHVKEHGFQIESVAGDFHLSEVQCARSSEEIGNVDLVIIAWKTTANSHYEKVIIPLLHEDTQIITLQNGLGNVEELSRLFGAERVFGGLCFVCINRLSAGVISHTASGLIRLGEYQRSEGGRLERLVEFLSDGGIHCEAVENLEKAQWMKLVWNIPFNGLAISEGGIDTEELLEKEGMEDRVLAIMKEVQSVVAALGHEVEDRFLERQISITKPMGKYRPSSMIDFVEGREVELNSIWKEPLKVAKALAVKTPEIEALTNSIEARIQA
ncbi:2-dehydropantoate 2-reductase [Akkermansiaceae bacterium]|nr:2-dehydropantoate 2-reductase [Akkermansiaceae bacterium]